jgi:quaternary ammonium compound-resistance protein SugE
MKHLPMAPAYSIWAGIGAVGAAAYGAMYMQEPMRALRVVSMTLIVIGIVGLKFSVTRGN